ncbi:4'-phosphopantetheinyl transferase superfamily protein [Jejubacter calystegiae]|uniref:Enterobactin synthase component D n=1 Tax=Jejubacter calystegiae TaxID=2579935 RepID=A0A4P8YH86_9ENTR|nr:4'-phosphopantetheinyl transferase superfamily protein [Jejubacter calystegiae]QCT19991.1 4'-phosphopantetheinyl transferase superfamily protein [Jejubacter calystegiae]
MFTFERHITNLDFIRQQSTGYANSHSGIKVCLVAFDEFSYRDTLFTQLSLPFPDVLKSAGAKRRAEYLAGRYAARQLLQEVGYNGVVATGTDRAPVWPRGWRGSISHTDTSAIAILTPNHFGISPGVDIEMFRPDIMQEIATSFTTADERDVLLAANCLPFDTALLIAFSAKESLFKALYPLVQQTFGFEVAKLYEIDPNTHTFTLELTRKLVPIFRAGYRVSGYYSIGPVGVTTMVYVSI